jgi:hypothetical protein
MPTALMRKYAKESGKSLEEVEKCWAQAKAMGHKLFEQEDEHFWAFVNSQTRKCLGLDKKGKKNGT